MAKASRRAGPPQEEYAEPQEDKPVTYKFEETPVMDRVRDKFARLNVRVPSRPKNAQQEFLNPRLPPDLTELSDVELGRLFSEFACMAQYVKIHLASRAVDHAIAKREERITRARIRLEKSGTIDDKNAKVEVDPRYREASHNLLVGEGTEAMTSALLESYVIGRDACSREMSRRQWAYEQQR